MLHDGQVRHRFAGRPDQPAVEHRTASGNGEAKGVAARVDHGHAGASDAPTVGPTLATQTIFLPTNQPIDIGVRTAYVDQMRYFAAVGRGGDADVLPRQDVIMLDETDPMSIGFYCCGGWPLATRAVW